MPIATKVFLFAVTVLCLYQGYVSWHVARSTAFTRKQKVIQLALVWLLPLIGAIVVHWFATVGAEDAPEDDKDFVRQDIAAPGVTRVNW